MDAERLNDLRPGRRMRVAFSGRGSQTAEFIRYGVRSGSKSLVVRKWRERSQSWTKPVHVLPDEVLGLFGR